MSRPPIRYSSMNPSSSRRQQQLHQSEQSQPAPRSGQRVRFVDLEEEATYVGSSSGSGSGNNSLTNEEGGEREGEDYSNRSSSVLVVPVVDGDNDDNSDDNHNNNSTDGPSIQFLLQMGSVSVMMLVFVMVSVAHLAVRYNSSETSTVPNFPDHLNTHNKEIKNLNIPSPLVTADDSQIIPSPVLAATTTSANVIVDTTITTTAENNTPDAGIIIPVLENDDDEHDEVTSDSPFDESENDNTGISSDLMNHTTSGMEETLPYDSDVLPMPNNNITVTDDDDNFDDNNINDEILTASVTEPTENISSTFSLLNDNEDYADSNYDFYLFDMRYVPGFCSVHNEETYEACQQPNINQTSQLTIHGLWPNVIDGTYPEYCSSYQDNKTLDPEIVKELASQFTQLWPDEKNPHPNNPLDMMELYDHEWKRHGTCTNLTQRQYFMAAFESYYQPNPPTIIQDHYGKTILADTLRSAFETMTIATTSPTSPASPDSRTVPSPPNALRGPAVSSDLQSSSSSVMLVCSSSEEETSNNTSLKNVLQEVIICMNLDEKGAPGMAVPCSEGVIKAHEHSLCDGDVIVLPKFQQDEVQTDVVELVDHDPHTNSL